MNQNLVGSICQVFYQDWSFRPDPFTNMATTGHSCFSLGFFLPSFDSFAQAISEENIF
jgi:hypothetical protein